jgi:glycyl-tRNA synthetase beta chain
MSAYLLVELLVEELPPKALKLLGESFASSVFETLKTQSLTQVSSVAKAFASPRRLAVLISDVLVKAEDKPVLQKLMPANIGLDQNGQPTPALLKKLQSLGADADAVPGLKTEHDGKTDVLYFDALIKGASLAEGLQVAINTALEKLPIPKVMSYQLKDGWETVHFVRPAHGLIAMYGSEIVPIQVLGLKAGNQTQGHRFEASKPVILIDQAEQYETILETEGRVIACFNKRLETIRKSLYNIAHQKNLTPIEDEALLEEVTALVEYPNVLLGQFEEAFLEVPQECLILTMKANQKYFPLLDKNGRLTNQFLIVSNISPADPFNVIDGNERVVRPRLSDAKFFYDQDRKKTLASRLEGLSKVVYHNKLGSQSDRSQRVSRLAQWIAERIGDAHLAEQAGLAASLAKADLLTDMVGEFPELQGIMGRYYAQFEQMPDDIAFAIEDHYRPRFAGDALPRSKVGLAVALADKLETLVGLFSVGERPTGDKDPFALRRQALGIIRMLIEAQLPLSFPSLIEAALEPFKVSEDVSSKLIEEILAFSNDRLSVSLKDQGATAHEVDAVLAIQPNFLFEIPSRLEAVRAFTQLSEAPALAAANKRVANILKKLETRVQGNINSSLLVEPAEKVLAQALSTIRPVADELFEQGQYRDSLKTLAALKEPVDAFFDQVMVNADDPQLKNNRLSLLSDLHATMNRVADLSSLAS